MIDPVPYSVRDNILARFLEALRLKLNGRVRLDTYTTAERDLITDWNPGDLIFNSTVDSAQVRTSSGWNTI